MPITLVKEETQEEISAVLYGLVDKINSQKDFSKVPELVGQLHAEMKKRKRYYADDALLKTPWGYHRSLGHVADYEVWYLKTHFDTPQNLAEALIEILPDFFKPMTI